jgi:hypothetical protein
MRVVSEASRCKGAYIPCPHSNHTSRAHSLASATTLRRPRDEWIEARVMATLRELALEAYDKLIGLQLSDVAVDCCITKARDVWR